MDSARFMDASAKSTVFLVYVHSVQVAMFKRQPLAFANPERSFSSGRKTFDEAMAIAKDARSQALFCRASSRTCRHLMSRKSSK